MGILTKEVKVRLNANNVNYYKQLGYNIPIKEACKSMKYQGIDYAADFTKSILVKIEDLPLNSKTLIESTCDYCGQPKSPIKYSDYNKQTKNGVLKCCCEKCAPLKLKEIIFEKYGVEHVAQLDEITRKTKQTNLQKFGYESPMQSPDFLRKWLAKNSCNFIIASKQQRYLCNLYNGILNHPFQHYALDIYIPENKLDIEFDGSGHKMRVLMGKMTEEEFKKSEIVRSNVIKKEGYKIMRIISLKNLLPSDEILLQMLSEAKQYFSKYPNHSWVEFDIDSSTIRNAENKDGITYNYGKLRKIKDSDL